jgi:membrane protein YqaA with SNARE-associated domain
VKFFRPLLTFLFHLGYFGPLVMGVLDSSFLVLPFGNDLVVVGLVAQKHHGAPFYVLSAAIGSTLGALLLALVARAVGEEGVQKLAGRRKFDRLKKHMGHRAAIAIAVSALAPPPFPYTLVIAAASALAYSIWRILVVNFVARAIRFTILAILAIKFGRYILEISKSTPFLWTMAVFILLCLVGSTFSIWKWVRQSRS